MGFIKSPFNYTGGKYKLLPQIAPHFPNDADVMVDAFAGGFNVGINSNAKTIVYNDLLTPIVELQKYFYEHNCDDILLYIDKTIMDYGLSMHDKDSFNVFREHYNETSDCPLDLYILMCFSFNYQPRWNTKHQYNSSHGTNRSTYNESFKKRLTSYISTLQDKSVVFNNCNFTDPKIYKGITQDSFIYIDPPYYLSTANYNDGNRGYVQWADHEEQHLYKLINKLQDQNIPYGLNNLLYHKDKTNPYLHEFIYENSKDLRIVQMKNNYDNCNYQKTTQKGNTVELYITNIK